MPRPNHPRRRDRHSTMVLMMLVLLWAAAMAFLWGMRPAYARTVDRDTIGDMLNCSSLTIPPLPDGGPAKEVFHLAGDAETGLQGDTMWRPHSLGQPKCLYTFGNGVEMLVEIDVYQLPGEPLSLHLLCPHCMAREHGERNALRLTGDRKQMHYDPTSSPPAFPGWTTAQMAEIPGGVGGTLSVSDRFRCSWEVDARYREAIGNICDFEVVIDRNVIRRVTQSLSGSLPRGLR